MTKSDLYKEMIQQLVDHLHSTGVITDSEKDQVDDNILIKHYEDACDDLLTVLVGKCYFKVVKYLKEGLSENDILATPLPLRNRIANKDDEKQLSVFCWRSNNLSVITAKAIRALVTRPDDRVFDSACFSVLEMIWLSNKSDASAMRHLWEICLGQHQNEYYIFTSLPEDKDWRQYAFAYFCYVNDNHFARPTELNFTASTRFFPSTITYNSANKYEQYFDAYNVISESKYADDVLIRYLRMYQILEYFGYRRTLAEMTKGNIRDNGFIRNLISKASGRTSNEFSEIKNGLKDLLPPLASTSSHSGVFSSADITTSMESFIKNKLLLPTYSFSDDHLWMVFYKLRNCIVHNKESELHFSYANTDSYRDGIELMRLYIQRLEPEIVNLINDPSITGLEFDNQYVQVY